MQQIIKEPYLGQLRNEVNELKRLVGGEPNDIVIGQAWASLDKITEVLSQLAPNNRKVVR